jgi:Predicted membrane protein (DUF2306)
MAYWRILHRDIQSHRQWMVRAYALTFAAVTLRLWLVIFQVTGIDLRRAMWPSPGCPGSRT